MTRWYPEQRHRLAVQSLDDLRLRGLGMGLQQRHGLKNHARRAVAALHGALVEERLLHGVQLPARGEAFDGDDLAALRRAHRRHAGEDRLVVEKHGAGAALAFAAAVFRSRQPQVFAQHFEQGPLGLRVYAARRSVDRKANRRHSSKPLR